MGSPLRKQRTSSEIDPFSAAHIYYAEPHYQPKNHYRTRTYSSVSWMTLFPDGACANLLIPRTRAPPRTARSLKSSSRVGVAVMVIPRCLLAPDYPFANHPLR
jgi:hypothetical protein